METSVRVQGLISIALPSFLLSFLPNFSSKIFTKWKFGHASKLGWKLGSSISLIHVCLYPCLCVHGTAEKLDGVAELPDTQTAQQTDMKETY